MEHTDRVEHVVVPGTFDPITYGHIDVVRRARRIAGRVTVAVAASLGKNGTGPALTLDERVELARQALADEGVSEGVDVRPLTGLLVDFCHEVGAGAVVKGLRAMTDFEYELQLAQTNKVIAPDIDTIFLHEQPRLRLRFELHRPRARRPRRRRLHARAAMRREKAPRALLDRLALRVVSAANETLLAPHEGRNLSRMQLSRFLIPRKEPK